MTAAALVEINRDIVDLHSQGLTINEISHRVPSSFRRIKDVLFKAGLTPNTRRNRKGQSMREKERVLHESYAIYQGGGETSVSHGISKESAERALSIMAAGRVLVNRGVRLVGEAK